MSFVGRQHQYWTSPPPPNFTCLYRCLVQALETDNPGVRASRLILNCRWVSRGTAWSIVAFNEGHQKEKAASSPDGCNSHFPLRVNKESMSCPLFSVSWNNGKHVPKDTDKSEQCRSSVPGRGPNIQYMNEAGDWRKWRLVCERKGAETWETMRKSSGYKTYLSEKKQRCGFERCDGLVYYLHLSRSGETFLPTSPFLLVLSLTGPLVMLVLVLTSLWTDITHQLSRKLMQKNLDMHGSYI